MFAQIDKIMVDDASLIPDFVPRSSISIGEILNPEQPNSVPQSSISLLNILNPSKPKTEQPELTPAIESESSSHLSERHPAPASPHQQPVADTKISKRKAKAVTVDDSDNEYANSDEERYGFGSVDTSKF
jgi:hypothetical protein